MEDKTCNLGFLACNAGDLGLITESESSPGDENGNPLQYSCLGNPMDRGAWWIRVHGVARVGRDLVTIHHHNPLILVIRLNRKKQ